MDIKNNGNTWTPQAIRDLYATNTLPEMNNGEGFVPWDQIGYGDVYAKDVYRTSGEGLDFGDRNESPLFKKLTPDEEMRGLANLRFSQSVGDFVGGGDMYDIYKPSQQGLGYDMGDNGRGGQQGYQLYDLPIIPLDDVFSGVTRDDLALAKKGRQMGQIRNTWADALLKNREALAPSMESLAAGTAYGQPRYGLQAALLNGAQDDEEFI